MELLGILLPVAIDFINRKIEDSDVRFWVSVVICSLVGVGINYLDTAFSFGSVKAGFESVSASIVLVFGWAQLSYKAVWSNTKVLGEMRDELGLNAKEQ